MMRQIIIESFTKLWKRKKLWPLGALVSLAWQFEELGLFNRVTISDAAGLETLQFWSELGGTQLFTKSGLAGMFKLLQNEPISFFQIVLALGFLGAAILVLIWLTMASLGGLAAELGDEKHLKDSTFKNSLKRGGKKFWKLLFLNIVIKTLFSLVFFFFLLNILSKSIWLNLVLFLAAFLVYLVFSISFKYSICGIMLKNWGLFEAAKKSLLMLKKTPRESFGLAITLGLATFALMISGFAALLLILVPFATIGIAAFFLQLELAVILVLLLYGALAVFLHLILRGAITVFSWSAWVSLFQKISS